MFQRATHINNKFFYPSQNFESIIFIYNNFCSTLFYLFNASLFIGDYIELLGAKKLVNPKSVDYKSYLKAFIVFSIDKKLIKITWISVFETI